MAVRFRSLASGRLGPVVNIFQRLYPVPDDNAFPAGKAVIVRVMRFVNTYSGPVPISVILSRADGEWPLFPRDLILGSGLMLLEDQEFTLVAGESISAKVGKNGDANAAYANAIEFVISGVDRDL